MLYALAVLRYDLPVVYYISWAVFTLIQQCWCGNAGHAEKDTGAVFFLHSLDTAVLQPRDQVFAPSGSTFELACLIPNRTFPSSPTTVQPPIDWYYDYSCDARDRTQPCFRFTRLGSTTTRLQQLNGAVDTLLTTTISNFNTANVGFYSCRVLPLPDISGLKDYPDYLIQQSVSVILSRKSSHTCFFEEFGCECFAARIQVSLYAAWHSFLLCTPIA